MAYEILMRPKPAMQTHPVSAAPKLLDQLRHPIRRLHYSIRTAEAQHIGLALQQNSQLTARLWPQLEVIVRFPCGAVKISNFLALGLECWIEIPVYQKLFNKIR
jgi:hypothetical protein